MSIREDTQTMDVLNHLKEHKAITSKEAFNMYGIERLASVIYRLRYIWNYEIKTVMITVKNRRGKDVDVAKYILIGDGKMEAKN